MPLSFTFDPPKTKRVQQRYREEELRRMTVLQLQDICKQEDIISSARDAMDADELIHLILTFRGSRRPSLILAEDAQGNGRLEEALAKAGMQELDHKISMSAKITVFQGLDTNLFDSYRIPFAQEIENVNAAVIDNQGRICAVMQVQSFAGQDDLYLTRSGEMSCREAEVRDYKLLIFPAKLSDAVCDVYYGRRDSLLPTIQLYVVPLLDFVVREPVESPMPLVIDFGTSNTAAGVYINNQFYNEVKDSVHDGQLSPDDINYVYYQTPEGGTAPVIPTVIGVDRIEDGKPVYNIGFEAEKMVTDGYMGEGFCIFYDIKRWVGNFEAEEELSDHAGHRLPVKRKEIVRAFLLYVIQNARQRFKANFTGVFLCYPVKQKARFLSMYHEVLPEYEIFSDDLIDEGTAVLYNTIRRLIDNRQYEEGQWYKALIIDCGGGTTDQSSSRFAIRNERISYRIDVETAYENGDTDFGGSNLTYRILQLLKIAAANHLGGAGASLRDIALGLDMDIYRVVDEQGVQAVYKSLDEAYAGAESVIPTRFKEYEHRDRAEYFMVRNNYYYLFTLAEKVKKAFFSDSQISRIAVGSVKPEYLDEDTIFHRAPRWKLAVRGWDSLDVVKNFPTVMLSANLVKAALSGDIYDIIRRFLGGLFGSGELAEYRIVNLTGQSCKIDTFRDAIKEYIPGSLIRGRREKGSEDYRLKLTCLEGAIRFISDRRLGIAKVTITSTAPAMPYYLNAFTHTGVETTLLQPLDRAGNHGTISRSMDSVELRLHLKNTRNEEKYIYSVLCEPENFTDVTYEEIEEKYGSYIPQAEVDVIDNGELRYFVWADSGEWGFSVVPISRSNDQLRMGVQQMFPFESESWIVNFFSGVW